MSIPFYDLSVGNYLQTLGAVANYLKKGRAHCEAHNIDLNEVVETRLFPDMLPFHFQIVSVTHHSLGAIKGMQAGIFAPPSPESSLDYDGLQKLVTDARSALQQYTPETVNELQGKELVFKLGDNNIPFLAEGFVMSFSLPNFYFHAATAYDILRMKGVPIGKRDFIGQLRLKK